MAKKVETEIKKQIKATKEGGEKLVEKVGN